MADDFDESLTDDERLILYGPIVHANNALRKRGMNPEAIAAEGRKMGETLGWHREDPAQWGHLNEGVWPAEVWSRGHADLAAAVWMTYPPYREEWRAVVHHWTLDRGTTRGEAMRQARVVQDALEAPELELDAEAQVLIAELNEEEPGPST